MEQHEQALPATEENLLLTLAAELRDGTLQPRRELMVGEVEDLDERFNVREVWARLSIDHPALSPAENAALVAAFAERYDTLPRPATHEHTHQHSGSHHDCGKAHGPLRRQLDKLETKTLGKIRNKTIQALAAAAFRCSALVFCPGDDLLAIGAQVYGSVSGHTEGHNDQHHEEQAVLPRRPRIEVDLTAKKVRMRRGALDTDPSPPEADTCSPIEDRSPRERPEEKPQRSHKTLHRPEKRRRRSRIMAFGAMALAALGIGVSGSTQQIEPSPDVSTSIMSVQPGAHPDRQDDHERDKPQLFDHVAVESGNSQWGITEVRVEAATRGHNVAVINAVTAYTVLANQSSHPDPNRIAVGESLAVASPYVIQAFDTALTRPEQAQPELVQFVNVLNNQTDYFSESAQAAQKKIDSLLVK